jgi:hypothetical protein
VNTDNRLRPEDPPIKKQNIEEEKLSFLLLKSEHLREPFKKQTIQRL